MQYGVDVAIRRADDLDKLMIEEVSARKTCDKTTTVLDIGSGAGGQSQRLTRQGATVTAIDIADYTKAFADINIALQAEDLQNSISFVQADVSDWIKTTIEKFDLVICQRTLHYLPYDKAKQLLEVLHKRTKGQLYLSVTGATSAIADKYQSLSIPIEERFALLSSDAQETFSITAPLCIYYESELFDLLEVSGWRITWSRVSDFGNIKVLAIPA